MARHVTATLVLALALFLFWDEGLGQEQGGRAGRTTSVNGAELYYEMHGSGTPLLLLHSFGNSSELWRPFLSEFAKQYRVITIDLRGHGRSTNPSGRFTHRQAALDVLGVLDSLGVGQVKAVGASSGAMTLIHVATREPDRIGAMVLVGGTPYSPEENRAIQRAPDCGNLTPEVWQRKRQLHVHGDEQIRALERQFCGMADNYDDMSFTPPYLSTIKARTLIVHGDRDRYFPVHLAGEMYQAIPHSYLWVIPNGGHLPVFGPEHSTEFQRAVLAFCDGEWDQD